MSCKMKILVVGKKNHLFWSEHVCDALKDLDIDHNLFLYNDLPLTTHCFLKMTKLLNKRYADELLSHYFSYVIQTYNPDIILLISAFFLPDTIYHVLQKIKNKISIVGWVGDAFNHTVEHKALTCNHLYCTDSYFVDYARKEYNWNHVAYLPLAYNPHIFSHSVSQAFSERTGVYFVGNPALDRLELLKCITTPVHLVGSKWKKHSLKQHIIHGKNISIHSVSKIYQQCRGVINIKQEVNVINGLNMRSFEATACGALMIHDNVADIKKHFVPNEEILVYNNVEELNDLLQNINKNPQSFYEIAQRGMQRTLLEHSYKHRMAHVLGNLSYNGKANEGEY